MLIYQGVSNITSWKIPGSSSMSFPLKLGFRFPVDGESILQPIAIPNRNTVNHGNIKHYWNNRYNTQ